MLLGIDRQGWLTLLVGLLVALVTLFSSYERIDLLALTSISIRINQQIGILILLASLAALVGEVKLASNYRLRDQRARDRAENAAARERRLAARDRARAENAAVEERDRADQERNRAAEERERASRRARLQNRCTLAQLEFQLDPGPATRRQLADLIALLREYGELG